MRILLTCLMLLLSYPAFAQDENSALKYNQRLKKLCNTSADVNYVPSENVEYQPGIDAKGNFIVPPDIGFAAQPNIFPMQIPIELDIIERFDLDVPIGIIADPEVAGVVIHEGGKVTYNGQDVTNNIQAFCQKNELIVIDDKAIEPAELKPAQKTSSPQYKEIDVEELPPLDGSYE